MSLCWIVGHRTVHGGFDSGVALCFGHKQVASSNEGKAKAVPLQA
jgi:hypothetical protein